MITLTSEQARQIEVALLNWKAYVPLGKVALWDESDEQALAAIRAARAQEQAEQEPVAWTYEEVKSAFEYLKLQVKGPDDKWTVGESCTYFGFFRHGIDAATQRRTSPVRTKDLTDGEKFLLIEAYEIQKYKWTAMDFVDAVIAADRKLNGVEK